MFTREKKLDLMKGLMWDYHFPPEECLEVMEGSRKNVGHYNEYTLFRKMLEAYPWYTIMGILPLERIAELMTDKVLYSLRFKSLTNLYLYVRSRLLENIRITR